MSLAALVLLQLAQVPLVLQLVRRLRADQAERERLLQHALDSSDLERRRIAGDLHDGVVQELSGVSYTLSALSRTPSIPTTASSTLHESAAQVRGAINGLRSLLVEIYPPNLALEGIESALIDLAARLATSGVQTSLNVAPQLDDLPADVAALVYRCAQETLRNISRHARAEHATIDIVFDDAHCVLTVEDDGSGFDLDRLGAAQQDGHVGMRVLADLVADFGGSVTVESSPGEGTRVMVDIPVKR